MAKTLKKQAKPKVVKPSQQECSCSGDKTLQIIGLIVNIFILPGLGSIIGGRVKTGIWQLVLLFVGIIMIVVGLLLSAIVIGIPILIAGIIIEIAVWIWGIVTGIKMIKCSH